MFNTIVQILFAELATFINFFFFFFFTSELFSSAYLTLQCLLHGCKFRVNTVLVVFGHTIFESVFYYMSLNEYNVLCEPSSDIGVPSSGPFSLLMLYST